MINKKYIPSRKTILLSLSFGALSSLPLLTLAQTNDLTYQLLVPIPQFGSTYTPSNFLKYVETIITLAITIAAVAAVARITMGGFKYMTGASVGMKEAGKDDIRESVLGLILLASSYLILNTINPALLNFKLEVPAIIQGNYRDSGTTPSISGTQTPPPLTNNSQRQEEQQKTISKKGINTSMDPSRQYQLQEPNGINQKNLTSDSCQSWVAAKAKQKPPIIASCVPQ